MTATDPPPAVVGTGGRLTVEQTRRLVAAVAVLRAQRDALRAGMTLAELDAHEWAVEVADVDAAGYEQRSA